MTTMTQYATTPTISTSRRMDYFPPITYPATMFQRRKKKSPRELYHLSPQNHDLILRNPPVTPWDDPPEFFRTFIGTPNDPPVRQDSDLTKSTWPFLRQLGPKCVFRGMPKKPKDGGGGDAFDYSKDANYKVKTKYAASKGSARNRFLEPECIGISPSFSNPDMFSPQFVRYQVASGARRDVESTQSREISAKLRLELSMGRVKAPPPSEIRSAMSDDSLPGTRFPRTTPVDLTILHECEQDAGGSRDVPKGKLSRSAAKAKFVRFEESPLPSRLRHFTVDTPDSQVDNADMNTLTWRDIVQARVTRMRHPADDTSLIRAAGCAQPMEEIKEDADVAWRLPRSTSTPAASAAPAAAATPITTPRDLTIRVINYDRRISPKVSSQDISSWIDDVRRAQKVPISR